MVGAVRRIRRPGCKFDTMPVLKGPQGWNKSTAFRVLFGDDYFSDTNLGNLTNKDAPMKLRGIWCHEFSEVGSLRKHDVDALKAFVSSQVDRNRDPYERLVADVPRSNVFAATANEGGSSRRRDRRAAVLAVGTARPYRPRRARSRPRPIMGRSRGARSRGRVLRFAREAYGRSQASAKRAETIAGPLGRYPAANTSTGRGRGDLDPFATTVETMPRLIGSIPSDLFAALGIPPKDQNKASGRPPANRHGSPLGWKHKVAVRIGYRNRAGYARKKRRGK